VLDSKRAKRTVRVEVHTNCNWCTCIVSNSVLNTVVRNNSNNT